MPSRTTDMRPPLDATWASDRPREVVFCGRSISTVAQFGVGAGSSATAVRLGGKPRNRIAAAVSRIAAMESGQVLRGARPDRTRLAADFAGIRTIGFGDQLSFTAEPEADQLESQNRETNMEVGRQVGSNRGDFLQPKRDVDRVNPERDLRQPVD